VPELLSLGGKNTLMKTHDAQMLEATKIAIQSLVILAFFYCMLFTRSATLMGITGAAGFTISFCLHPHHFRSRSGSLIPAYCLMAFAWLCGSVPFLLSFFGEH